MEFLRTPKTKIPNEKQNHRQKSTGAESLCYANVQRYPVIFLQSQKVKLWDPELLITFSPKFLPLKPAGIWSYSSSFSIHVHSNKRLFITPETWMLAYWLYQTIMTSMLTLTVLELTWRTIWKVHIQNSASIKYTMCSHTVRLLCLIKNAWSKVGWTSSRVAACTTGPLPVWLDVLFWLLALRLQTSTKSKYQLFHHCCLSCWNTLLMRAGDQRAAFIGWCVQAWERRIRWAQWLGAAESFGFFHHQSQHQEFSSCFSDKQCWVQIFTLAHIKNHIFQPH